MIDLNYIRQNLDKIKELVEIGRAPKEKVNIDLWVELDTKRKSLLINLIK